MSKLTLAVVALSTLYLSGCATRPAVVRDLFGLSSNALELAQMDAGDVCKEVGFEMYRGRTKSYIAAKDEADRRINAYEVSADNCAVFAQMGMRQKAAQMESINAGLQQSRPTQTTCNPNGLGGFTCSGY